jgi:hypothetical protein
MTDPFSFSVPTRPDNPRDEVIQILYQQFVRSLYLDVMKHAAAPILCILLVASLPLDALDELESVSPIKVHFATPRIVFASSEESATQALGFARTNLFRRDYLLDAKERTKEGVIWCKRGRGESYTDVFREREVSAKQIVGLERASASDLSKIFGKQLWADGTAGEGGTTFYNWRTFNGERGDRMAAFEAVAAFKGRSRTNALFLLISTNSTELPKR